MREYILVSISAGGKPNCFPCYNFAIRNLLKTGVPLGFSERKYIRNEAYQY